MPLATSLVAGSDLPTVVATIALKRLYGTELPDDVRKGSQWADDYLTALAKGTVNLGVLDSQAAPAPGVVTSRTEPKRFDWAAY
jgi:phage gp36-like protein